VENVNNLFLIPVFFKLLNCENKKMKTIKKLIQAKYFLFLQLIFIFFLFTAFKTDWGFFVHRRINRLAVFTLPIELIPFYKKNIEYLTAHAVDPDKRRYMVPIEGQKHFIDLDYWENKELPRSFFKARRKFANIFIVSEKKDTLCIIGEKVKEVGEWNVVLKGTGFQNVFKRDSLVFLRENYNRFFYQHIYNPRYEKDWVVNCDSVQSFFQFHGFDLDCQKAFVVDTLLQHGFLPFHLIRMQKSLTEAMRLGNVEQILKFSADFGHYIGDAHVPLHTHSNYNGQQSDQYGIHAFWETRLPELFADEQYNYFVGKAAYISNPENYYWSIIEESHALVHDVLNIEKELSNVFPKDQQDCIIQRGEAAFVEMACEEYALLYHQKLNGQVENRLRAAIKAVGDAWYTAWVDAGQPRLDLLLNNLDRNKELIENQTLEKAVHSKKILGRDHQN
jgi:hypothetical protein